LPLPISSAPITSNKKSLKTELNYGKGLLSRARSQLRLWLLQKKSPTKCFVEEVVYFKNRGAIISIISIIKTKELLLVKTEELLLVLFVFSVQNTVRARS
jgi:hypothetical protein